MTAFSTEYKEDILEFLEDTGILLTFRKVTKGTANPITQKRTRTKEAEIEGKCFPPYNAESIRVNNDTVLSDDIFVVCLSLEPHNTIKPEKGVSLIFKFEGQEYELEDWESLNVEGTPVGYEMQFRKGS